MRILIRIYILMNRKIRRPSPLIRKFEIIFKQQVRQNQLDLIHSENPARTRPFAIAKVETILFRHSELVEIGLIRVLALFVESHGIQFVCAWH